MKNNYLAKHDDFIVANYDFELDTQRLFFACLYKMNSGYYKPLINELSYIYKLDFEEIKKISGINYDFENHKNKVRRATKDLTEKIVEITTKRGFVVTGIVKTFRIDEIDKTVLVEIDKEIKPYLVATFKKFTKVGFKHLSLCQSKYTLKLYEILIMKSKLIDKKINTKIIKLSVEEIRNSLKIPKSYDFSKFKKRVLEKANIEYNALDIENIEEKKSKKLFKIFNYKTVETPKRGRGKNPITHIIFEFELLEETKFLMMSKKEKLLKELENENWIMTKLNILISENKEREPYFKKLEINYIFGFITETIEDIKKEFNITGITNQNLILEVLEKAFNTFKKYPKKTFEDYLKKGFRMKCESYLKFGKSLEEY